MPPHHPPIPKAPQPTKIYFDPFHSPSSGHQIHAAKLAGSTSWRESRTHKLAEQLKDTTGRGGKKHLSDLVGAGSENWQKDGRKDNGDWEPGAPGLREKGWQDIRALVGGRTRKRSNEDSRNDAGEGDKQHKRVKIEEGDLEDGKFRISRPSSSSNKEIHNTNARPVSEDDNTNNHATQTPELTTSTRSNPGALTSSFSIQPPQIFHGLTIYLNGSTAPLVSDHKLKQLFTQHGGNASIALGRRTVTHVIIGDGCGGGLASTKINKENTTVRGKSIKFVTAHWILDSIEKGIRQPESRYVPGNLEKKIGGSGQVSVKGIFSRKET